MCPKALDIDLKFLKLRGVAWDSDWRIKLSRSDVVGIDDRSGHRRDKPDPT
jgi:hypothetical protein